MFSVQVAFLVALPGEIELRMPRLRNCAAAFTTPPPSNFASLFLNLQQSTIIMSLALRTSLRSLSSTHVRPAAVHKLPAFGFTQIRRFGLAFYRTGSGPIDPEPKDDPNLFDVLLSDVNYHIIHGDVSKKLGYEYLARVPKKAEFLKPSSQVSGILYGIHHRPFFPLITTLGDRSHFLHFLFDSGSPFTYLSYDVSSNHSKHSTFNNSSPFLGLRCFLRQQSSSGRHQCHIEWTCGFGTPGTCDISL